MKIPSSGRKKALIITDVQYNFINNRNSYIISNIERLISNIEYNLYIFSLSYNAYNSIWCKQKNWHELVNKKDSIYKGLFPKVSNNNKIITNKLSASVFKGDIDIFNIMKNQNIEEVHITGYETNECVMATLFESFDYQFFSYAIEECCESGTYKENHDKAVDLLRYNHLTNNSCIENIDFISL